MAVGTALSTGLRLFVLDGHHTQEFGDSFGGRGLSGPGRGEHLKMDHPERDDRRWLGNIRVRFDQGRSGIRFSYGRAGIDSWATAPMPT